MAYLNFGWILHGSLAAAQGPTSRRDLVFLSLQKILSIVRMEPQTISGEEMDLVDLYEPVVDGTPPSLEQIDRMVQFIEEQRKTMERPVVVTCYAGLGRTGTVLACYMVYAGYTPDQAISHIRELRPGSIQTRTQGEAVHQYAELLTSQGRGFRRSAQEASEEL